MEYLTYDKFEKELSALGFGVAVYNDDLETLLVLDERYTFQPFIEISKREQYAIRIYDNKLLNPPEELYKLAWRLAGTPINKRVNKEVHFILPMDGTGYKNINANFVQAFAVFDSVKDNWSIVFRETGNEKPYMFVTQEQIDNAPDWVKGINPIEVNE